MSNIMTAMGKIEKVYFKELPVVDAYDNNYRLSIFVKHNDGTEAWYSVGATKGQAWNVKQGTGFKEVGAGSEVVVKYTTDPTGKYRNTKKSDIMFLNLLEPSQAPAPTPRAAPAGNASAPAAPYQKRDNTGVATGHALNCAVYALGIGNIHDTEVLLKEARRWHVLTEALGAWALGEFPEYSVYDREASAGQAIKAASEAGAAHKDSVILAYAKAIMLAAGKLKAEIKAGSIEIELDLDAPAVKKETQSKAKAKVAKVETPVVEDFEDDLPF